MPAPAVIPAPIAYINAAAVKKLVVGYRAQVVLWPFMFRLSVLLGSYKLGIHPTHQDLCSRNGGNGALRVGFFIEIESAYVLTIRIRVDHRSYCEQISVSKAGVRLE